MCLKFKGCGIKNKWVEDDDNDLKFVKSLICVIKIEKSVVKNVEVEFGNFIIRLLWYSDIFS